MNKAISLAKVLLKSGGGLGASKGGSKKHRSAILAAVVVLFAFLPMILGLGAMVSSAYSGLKAINHQGIILGLALSAAVIVIFFFGIMYTINTFYFSMDIEYLLPLPLRPEEILCARFITVMVYEYITEAFIVLPVTAVYGSKAGEGIIFYIYSLIIFLTLPVIPLSAAAVIDMIIMRFTNIAKNKDLFRIAAGIFAMFTALGVNLYIQRLTADINNPEKIAALLSQGNNSLMGAMYSLFPSTKAAAYALVEPSAISAMACLIGFLMLTAMFFIIFIYTGKLLYFKGVIGVSETASKRRNLGSRELNNRTRNRPIVFSYMIKELKLLFRSPVYFLNCILMNFLWPFFLLLPVAAQPNTTEGLKSLIPFIGSSSAEPLVLASVFAAAIFITASNMISATSLSREGKNIYFMKYIPVEYKTQLMGKVMSGAVMGLCGMAVMVPPAIIVLHLKPFMALLCLLVSSLGIMFSALGGIIIDAAMPKLNWDTEQKAVKQNLNGTIALFGFSAVAVLTFLLVKYLQQGLLAVAIELTVIFGIIDLTLYKIITGFCADKLREMDI